MDIEKDIKSFSLVYCHNKDYMQDRLQEYFEEYFEGLITIDDVEVIIIFGGKNHYVYDIHTKNKNDISIWLNEDEFITYLKGIYQPIELKRKIDNIHSAPSLR